MNEKYICIVCEGKQLKKFSYHNFHYFKCKKCGLVSTYPIPTKTRIKNHYKNEFHGGNYKFLRQFSKQYTKVYQGFTEELKKYLETENKKIKNLKILDIGCFTGDFLYSLSKEGADVFGVELQKDAVEIANHILPGKVIQADISENPFGKKKFDVVTMLGLIEHVQNPSQIMKNVSKIVKKGGVLVIQTPNSNSLFATILGKYWPPYAPIEHIHLLNKTSLNVLLKKNGFRSKIFKNHYKILPIAYVYNMLGVFGPEIKQLLKPIEKIYNPSKSKLSLPFYVGEMFIIAKKDS